MKSIITLVILLLSTSIFAGERAFRVERYYDTANGLAVAWGIPGQNLDFEKLDKMSMEEIEATIDLSKVKNFIVDLETNQIIDTIENEDFVSFNIGGMHFGNHYSVSLDKMRVENFPGSYDMTAVIENYKWSNSVTKIIAVESLDQNQIKTTIIDASETFETLHNKLKESILEKNLDLFENGAFNINNMETKFIENVGEVTELSLDYCFPKSDKNALEVIAQVKFKYVQGKIIPFIYSVKQKQY